MKRIFLVLFCGLAISVTGVAIPRQIHRQTRFSNETLVNSLGFLNKQEFFYRVKNHRYASGEELIEFLRQKGASSQSPIDLENPKPYELLITTSPDGMHYQVTVQRLPNRNDIGTWCRTAAFSDDSGVIFQGSDISC